MQPGSAKKAILLLEDGTYFEGRAAGKIGTATGEIAFSTGMTGYQEVFTDPSFYGQMLVATNVHIGNYGIKSTEAESASIKINGFICRNFTPAYSRQMADDSIQDYFEKQNLVAITGVDTRALVRHIRQKGAMNGILSSEILDIEQLKARLKEVPSMEGLELASRVSTDKIFDYGNPEAKHRVAVLDFGIKENILRCLAARDCFLRVFPAKTTFEEIETWNPDGYFLSNGPGDPAVMDYALETVKKITAARKKVFGICLGHQLIGMSVGIKTYKLHHGHRGINHPVKNLITGKCEITSQNHGFGLDANNIEAFKDLVEVSHINLNDNTIEGIRLKNGTGFSVQYHPEAAPGPHDARYLFDDFIRLLNKN